MKIIHCADLHLDSKLTSNLPKEKAKERKSELLNTFSNMVEYAKSNSVSSILIAGDLFDTRVVSATARNVVQKAILENPQIEFIYIRGNHDIESFLNNLEEKPNNLKLFDEKWGKYELSPYVNVIGTELTSNNYNIIYDSLILQPEKFNIVMLHGQESSSMAKNVTELISLKDLRNKYIDYLALGHVHTFKKEQLDSRCTYCYSGCLEGRGFDETGKHGFVLLDINEEEHCFKAEFIPIAKRELWDIEVDLTECYDTMEASKQIAEKLSCIDIPKKDLVKITLVGSIDVEAELNLNLITKRFEDNYYFFKVKDKTKLKVDMNEFALDQSLKGEFIRLVMNDAGLEDEEKATIVRYGIQALTGEEIV